MQKKLTHEQVDARVRMYQEAIDRMTIFVHGNKEGDSEQAAAIIKELRGTRKRFLKRMEATAVGRKIK
jgi:hypothetical protein